MATLFFRLFTKLIRFFVGFFCLLDGLFSTAASFIRRKILFRAAAAASLECPRLESKGLTLWDVPGPITFPVFGASWIYSFFGPYDRRAFHESNEDKLVRYGPVVREGVTFNYPLVHLFHKDDIEKVLKYPSAFPLRPPNVADAYYRRYRKEFYLNEGIVNLNGPEWHRLRVQLTPPLTNRKTPKHYAPHMNVIFEDLMALLEKKRDPVTKVVDDFKELAYLAGLETVSNIAMEKRMGFLEEEVSQETQLILDSIRGYQTACNESAYGLPWYQLFPKCFSPCFTNLVKHKDNLFLTIGKVVDEAVRQRRNGEEANNNSILHQLLDNKEVDLMDVKASVVDYITAGVETIGNTIIFAIALIAQSPRVRRKVTQELDEILPTGSEELDFEQIYRLKYLRACVQESYRIYPTASQIARILEEETEVEGGYRLPAGHVVLCHQRVAALQEENFTRAKEFLPERWLDGAEKEFPKCAKGLVVPYGVGKRCCPGKRCAEQMIYIITAKLFRKFDVSLVGDLKAEFNFLLAPSTLKLRVDEREF